MGEKTKMLAVVGPTASGKSDLALFLAKRFDGEVISCDSMQFYRGMDIGTAKATAEERARVPHHMIDICDIGQTFSVSAFVKAAYRIADDMIARGKLPILCGGTGLYADAFIDNVDFGDFQNDPAIHQALDALPTEVLLTRLQAVDSARADKLMPADRKRILRALEVYDTTGITMTEWENRSHLQGAKYQVLTLGIGYHDRERLYDRIDKRVDIMMQNGLLQEAKGLYDAGLPTAPTAGQAIGYKEFYPYFEGRETLEACVETLKCHSRRYAKRQLTWFRRNRNLYWLWRDQPLPQSAADEAANTLFAQALSDKDAKPFDDTTQGAAFVAERFVNDVYQEAEAVVQRFLCGTPTEE